MSPLPGTEPIKMNEPFMEFTICKGDITFYCSLVTCLSARTEICARCMEYMGWKFRIQA